MDELPILDLAESIYYNDFSILGSERSGGMGISHIPITRITHYAMQEGVHDLDMFKRIILRVDKHYCKLVNADQEKKAKARPKKTPKTRKK